MPVSKKRKKKRASNNATTPAVAVQKEGGSVVTAPKKKKLTNQQILIYVFSFLVIVSMVTSFLVGQGGSRSAPVELTPTIASEQSSQATPTSGGEKSTPNATEEPKK